MIKLEKEIVVFKIKCFYVDSSHREYKHIIWLVDSTTSKVCVVFLIECLFTLPENILFIENFLTDAAKNFFFLHEINIFQRLWHKSSQKNHYHQPVLMTPLQR